MLSVDINSYVEDNEWLSKWWHIQNSFDLKDRTHFQVAWYRSCRSSSLSVKGRMDSFSCVPDSTCTPTRSSNTKSNRRDWQARVFKFQWHFLEFFNLTQIIPSVHVIQNHSLMENHCCHGLLDSACFFRKETVVKDGREHVSGMLVVLLNFVQWLPNLSQFWG